MLADVKKTYFSLIFNQHSSSAILSFFSSSNVVESTFQRGKTIPEKKERKNCIGYFLFSYLAVQIFFVTAGID